MSYPSAVAPTCLLSFSKIGSDPSRTLQVLAEEYLFSPEASMTGCAPKRLTLRDLGFSGRLSIGPRIWAPGTFVTSRTLVDPKIYILPEVRSQERCSSSKTITVTLVQLEISHCCPLVMTMMTTRARSFA